jgi:hypothetical protein
LLDMDHPPFRTSKVRGAEGDPNQESRTYRGSFYPKFLKGLVGAHGLEPGTR